MSNNAPQIQYPYASLTTYNDQYNMVVVPEEDIPADCTKGFYVRYPATGVGQCLEFDELYNNATWDAHSQCYNACEAIYIGIYCSQLRTKHGTWLWYCSRDWAVPTSEKCGNSNCRDAKCFTFNEDGNVYNKCMVFKNLWECKKARKQIKDAGEYCECVEGDPKKTITQENREYYIYCKNDNIRTPKFTDYGDYFIENPDEILPQKPGDDNGGDVPDNPCQPDGPGAQASNGMLICVLLVLLAVVTAACVGISIAVVRRSRRARMMAESGGCDV